MVGKGHTLWLRKVVVWSRRSKIKMDLFVFDLTDLASPTHFIMPQKRVEDAYQTFSRSLALFE